MVGKMTYYGTEETKTRKSEFEVWFERIFRERLTPLTMGAVILTLISLSTTVIGLQLFFGNWLFSIPGGMVLQYLLFYLSMQAGRAASGLTKGAIGNFFVMILCVIFLCASSLSSAAFFWDVVFSGEQERQNLEAAVQNGVRSEVARMSEDRADQDAAFRDEIRTATKAWEPTFDTLVEIGQDAQTSLAEAIQAEINEKKTDLNDENTKLANLEASLGTGVASASEAESTIQQLQSQIAPLENEINTLRQSQAFFVNQKDEQTLRLNRTLSGDDNTLPTCGPICEDAKRQIAEAEEQIERLTQESAAVRREIGQIRSEIARLELVVQGSSEVDGLRADIAAVAQRTVELRAEISGLESRLRGISREGGNAAQGALAIVRADPSPTNYAATLRRCRETVDLFKRPESGVADRAQGLSCENGSLFAAIERYADFRNGEAKFLASCGATAEEFRALGQLPREEVITYGKKCLNLAGLSIATSQDYSEAFTNINLQNDPEAFIGTRVSNAIDRREPTLVQAGSAALFFDIAIVLCAWLAFRDEKMRKVEEGDVIDILEDKARKLLEIDTNVVPGDSDRDIVIKAIIDNLDHRHNPPIGSRRYSYQMDYTKMVEAAEQGGRLPTFKRLTTEQIKQFGRLEGQPPHQTLLVRDEFHTHFVNLLHAIQAKDRANGGAAFSGRYGEDSFGDPIGHSPNYIEPEDATQGQSMFATDDDMFDDDFEETNDHEAEDWPDEDIDEFDDDDFDEAGDTEDDKARRRATAGSFLKKDN